MGPAASLRRGFCSTRWHLRSLATVIANSLRVKSWKSTLYLGNTVCLGLLDRIAKHFILPLRFKNDGNNMKKCQGLLCFPGDSARVV